MKEKCARCGENTYDNGTYCLSCEEVIYYDGWETEV